MWSGNEYGRVTSFFGDQLQKYTSWQSNLSHDGPVRQILTCDYGVLSLGLQSLHLSIRRGLTSWHLVHEDFQDLRCMCFLSSSSEVLVAGCQPTMFKVDVEKGKIVETIEASSKYVIMRRGASYICAATTTGSVQVLNIKTLEIVSTWQAHRGRITDLDANDSYLMTCGSSPKTHNSDVPDPLVKVFDLKSLKAVSHLPFHAGAAFLRFHPRIPTTAVIVSSSGQMQLVDVRQTSEVRIYQMNVLPEANIVCMEMSVSGQAITFADSSCILHLWGIGEEVRFTNTNNNLEVADAVTQDHKILDWEGYEPLNTIGMPYYRDNLLSAWPSHMVFDIRKTHGPVDSEILENLRRSEYGTYAPWPRKELRNQARQAPITEPVQHGDEGPKFLSEQAKEANNEVGKGEPRARDEVDVTKSNSENATNGNASRHLVPLIYRDVEIKYSRFGIEDFDFQYYNRTEYSGLETHIANSYLNPLIQLLKYIPTIRNGVLMHTATYCRSEACLLCEMGFLFDMIEKAQGQNCQATNFLHAFGKTQHARTFGLVEGTHAHRPLNLVIQNATKFILEKITAEARHFSPSIDIGRLFTTLVRNSIRCGQCGHEVPSTKSVYAHVLDYRKRIAPRGHGPTFTQILKSSIESQGQTRGWCNQCRRHQFLSNSQRAGYLPPVLIINTDAHALEAGKLWAQRGWLPKQIGVKMDPRAQLQFFEGEALQHLIQQEIQVDIYELTGVIADIHSRDLQKSHLVSLINVAPSSTGHGDDQDWYIFNDFSVNQISDEELLRFDLNWKTPAVVAYQLVTPLRPRLDDSWKEKIDSELLYQLWNPRIEEQGVVFEKLRRGEINGPGTLVGIDAEFVELQKQELEIRPDATSSVIRPARLALARVSVVRGNSEESFPSEESQINPQSQNAAFIDDYIHIQEKIVDYLSQFSGIHQGDLDPQLSPYTVTGRLVPLKIAYKKIWLLLNLGCIFVGHGLLKDFRTINIHVPKKQVVDTVELYHDKSRGGRKIGLRFLSWLVLGIDIQSGSHDSIEDARTAFWLWRKWQYFERNGMTEHILKEVYRRGRDVNFKVPDGGKTATTYFDGDPLTTDYRARKAAGSVTPRPQTPMTPRGSDTHSLQPSPRTSPEYRYTPTSNTAHLAVPGLSMTDVDSDSDFSRDASRHYRSDSEATSVDAHVTSGDETSV